MAAEGLLRALERWTIREVSQVWVDTVWELDFTETERLASRLEGTITEDGVVAFTQLYKCLYPFAAKDTEIQESIWTLLAENNLTHSAVVAVLYHFVQDALNQKANLHQRLYAFHAAGLYFLLVEIPGSVVNRVFHPVMFEQCLQTLRKCFPQSSDLPRKRKKDNSKSSQGNRNKKKGRPIRERNSMMEEIFEEEEQEEELYFSAHDLLQLRDALFLLLKNLLRLLSKFSLKEKPQCVQTCIQIFVHLTSCEPCPTESGPSERTTIEQMKYIPELAYFGLRLLCSPLHGLEDQVLRSVFHQLLSVLLMLPGRDGSSRPSTTIPLRAIGARNQAIQFISSLTEQLKEGAYPVLRIFLQHVCVKVPDKSEYRTLAAQALAQLLHVFPCAEHAEFIAWLYRYSLNNKICYRAFALDVSLALLDLPEREPDATLSEEQQNFLMHKFLVQVMIFGRCSDKASVIRSKALSSFALCLQTKSSSQLETMQELLQGISGWTRLDTHLESRTFLTTTTESTSSRPPKTFPTFKTIDVTDRETLEFDGKAIVAMLRQRAGDEKTNVRKSALQVLLSILKHHIVPCTSEDLALLQDRCRDPAVSVRKQALQAITELLMAQPGNVLIQKAWLAGVTPIVMDCETSVQEKALDCLDQLLLQPIKHYQNFSLQDRSQALAWDLLMLFTNESQELGRYLNKAFHVWSKQGKFSSAFVNSVISHTETEHAAPAWMLLAKVAGSSPKLDYSKILEVWETVGRQPTVSTDTRVHMLCVIGNIAKHLPGSFHSKLRDDIQGWLQSFQCPLEAISPAVEALQKLCRASAVGPKETQELLDRVFGELVLVCENCISNIVVKVYEAEQLQEDILVKHLFTLGEVAQLCPAKVEKRIFLLIQSILADPANLSPSPAPLDGEDLPPSQPLSQFRGSVMPSVVRAHAFITLGKLCLQHEELAKKCIAPLVRELEVSQDLAVRNNVVIVLCDLCIRYTTMADRYIPDISVCLKDPEPFVRKQTLILLTNLLQEEFVKWKGSLFFRFVSVLVDPDQDISSFAEFCLLHVLLKRNPAMFSQHFIECIFHFNSYERHEKYNRFSQSEREKKLFSLKGKANKEKRMQIYKFLLEHFTDEQRFNITSKISLSILACFVDEVLPLDMEANELLSDTFEILSCKEIKLAAMRSKPEEDLQAEDDDELAMANVVMQVAQKKFISQVQKKNFVENIIPIITALKTLLEESRLPALRDLMNYLREVMQDYRNEMKEVFAMDKQLAAELEYDMRKYEEQLDRERGQGQSQDATLETEALNTAPTGQQQTPGSERMALPVDQVEVNSPAAARHWSPSRSSSSLPVEFTAPISRPRKMSLNTLAILNSAKKAIAAANKQRSRSVGGKPLSPDSLQNSKQASFCSLNQPSSGVNVRLEGRAISTPERTINNVTFGARVSCIGLMHTPALAQERGGTQDGQGEIVCLTAPDKPSSQCPKWQVNSPRRKSGPSKRRLRKSSCKTPLTAAH